MTPKQVKRRIEELVAEKSKIRHEEYNNIKYELYENIPEEEVKPNYSYTDTTLKLIAIDTEMRELKHALNAYNSTVVIIEDDEHYGDLTTDQVIILTAQISSMIDRLPLVFEAKREYKRVGTYSDPIYYWVEVNATEQEQEQAKNLYDSLIKRRAELYDKLDVANMTNEISI